MPHLAQAPAWPAAVGVEFLQPLLCGCKAAGLVVGPRNDYEGLLQGRLLCSHKGVAAGTRPPRRPWAAASVGALHVIRQVTCSLVVPTCLCSCHSGAE